MIDIFNRMQQASYNTTYKIIDNKVNFNLTLPYSVTDLSENIHIVYSFFEENNIIKRAVYAVLIRPALRQEGIIPTNDYESALNKFTHELSKRYESFDETTDLVSDLYKIEKEIFEFTRNFFK